MEIIAAVALLIGVVVLALLWSSKRAEAERIRSEQEWVAACNDSEVNQIVEQLCGDQLPSIETPRLSLQRGEFCFYVTEAGHYEMRTVTKRIEYAGITTSIRLKRGVYLRSGSFTPRRGTEEQLLFQDTGILYFTDKRLIFFGARKNVVITRKAILGVNPMRDAVEVEKTSGRNPVFVNK